jgi:hypothetical protein
MKEKTMNRFFKSIGIAAVMAACLIAVVAISGALYHQLAPITAEASTAEKAQDAAQDEGATRAAVVRDVANVKNALDSMQAKLQAGNVTEAQSDGAKLREQAAELSEVCARWNADLARLSVDGRALFTEWDALINSIVDVQHRLREGERFAQAKNRFERHLEEARTALAHTEEILVFFRDVERVIQSVDYAAKADDISGGLLTLTASASVRTRAFRSAADPVLAALQRMEDIVLS